MILRSARGHEQSAALLVAAALRVAVVRARDEHVPRAERVCPLRARARASRWHALLDRESFAVAIVGDGGEGLVVILIVRVRAQCERSAIEARRELADGGVVDLKWRSVVTRLVVIRGAQERVL